MIGELLEDSPKGAFSRTVAKVESDDLTKIADMVIYDNHGIFDSNEDSVSEVLNKIIDDNDLSSRSQSDMDKLDTDLNELAIMNVGFDYYQKI